MEAQMQVDQLADVLDHVMVEMQGAQTLAGHLRTDRIMMMEAHLAAGLETTGLRLADVVHQRGQTQRQIRRGHRTIRTGLQRDRAIDDDHRVFEHVLMTVMLVDLQLQCRNLGEHDIRQSGIDQRLDAGARTIGQQHLDQFIANALGGNDFYAIDHVRQRLGGFRRDAETQLRHETHGAHHAQRIVVERLPRIDGRTQYALGQIVGTAERIDEFQLGHTQRHRVDGEITTGQIALQGIAVVHLRLAGIRIIRIGTVCGDLNLHLRAVLTAPHRAERAELAAHVPKSVMSETTKDMLELFGARRCAKIQIMRFAMQQQIADGTSHQRQFIAFRGEHAP